LWSWSYCSWIYNYLCNQCLSPLMLWVPAPIMARCTRYNKLNNIIYLEKNCHCKYFLILFFSAAIIPEFTSGLRKCHAQQGKNAKFECEVSGTPAPDVQWFKGTRELFESKKYEIYNEGDKQILVSFFFWPLCCLSFFNLRILIISFVSSNSSYHKQY
jgi:hypothetical protein